MDDSTLLDGLRVWLDELGATEDQLAWVREARLEERRNAPLEILLLGQATAAEAEELANRVDSEPTLGGHVDSARFTPSSDAGTVGRPRRPRRLSGPANRIPAEPPRAFKRRSVTASSGTSSVGAAGPPPRAPRPVPDGSRVHKPEPDRFSTGCFGHDASA